MPEVFLVAVLLTEPPRELDRTKMSRSVAAGETLGAQMSAGTFSSLQ